MATKAEPIKDATVDTLASEISAKQNIPITQDLIALIAAAVATAVKESKRDEKAEAAAARAEVDRERVRQEELQRVANIKARQAQCPHLDAYENYAFVGQRNCTGQLVFICSQCVRPFRPEDTDYNNFVRFVKWDRVGNARQL